MLVLSDACYKSSRLNNEIEYNTLIINCNTHKYYGFWHKLYSMATIQKLVIFYSVILLKNK